MLYHFNGKEAVQFAKDVNNFVTDGAKRVVYITGNGYNGYALYGVTPGNTDDKRKLASDLNYAVPTEDY